MAFSDLPLVDVYRRFALKDNIDLLSQSFAPRVGDYVAPVESRSAYTAAAISANLLRSQFILLQRRMRFDRIAAYVSTAGGAGAEARLGIYNTDWQGAAPTYYPTSLILDAGTIDCTGTGSLEVIINQTLARGIYTLVFVTNDATINFRYRAEGLSPLGYSDASMGVSQGRIVAFAYAALPASFPVGGALYANRLLTLRVAELL